MTISCTFVFVQVPISPLESPQAVDFYAKEDSIYFSDSKKYLIGKRSVNGSGEIQTIIDSGELALTILLWKEKD